MNDEVKVSVIIPVYNEENYIEQCISSLINQSLREIEIICVDDGSTDGTLELLRKFEANDKRIKVIQQRNQYAGVARNNGLKHAVGEYMIFLDADDFFDRTLLEKTYHEAKRTEADVVLFGGQNYDDLTGEIKPAPWYLNIRFLPKNLPFNYADTDGQLLNAFSPAPWTKLFRSEFVRKNNIWFQPLQNSNDVYFILLSVCAAERISYVNECLVNYRRGVSTSLQSSKNKAPLCFLEAYHSVYETLVEKRIYEYVKKGFRSVVISNCLYNYDSYHYSDSLSRKILLEAFQKEKFLELDLFGGERDDYADWEKACRLKGLIDGYVWKTNLSAARRNVEAKYLKKKCLDFLPKVSVIIPCYNVENYVEECLDSILNQTLYEIEVICINDGSVDLTEEILVKVAEKDSRVSILTQKNAGLGATRNQGARYALGEYIYFMDSDDLLERNALEILYSISKEKELDVLYFDATSFYDTEELETLKPEFKEYYRRKNDYSDAKNGITMLVEMEKNKEYRSSSCLQIIRRKYFVDKELWYPQGVLHEDNSCTFKMMLLAKKVSHIPKTFFKRRIRENSITTSEINFAHSYGLFYNYIDMLKATEMVSLSAEQEAVVAKVLDETLNQARIKYRLLKEGEKYKYQCLEGIEQSLYYNFVVHSRFDLEEQIKAMKDLQSKEKNLKIKTGKLERELEHIKNSKSYKLALLLKAPVSRLRRIYKKIIGRENV